MPQPIENEYSDEDYHLIKINQLGIPLKIYRLKIKYIQKVYTISLFILIIGMAFLIAAIVISFIQWYSEQTSSYFDFLIFSPFPLSTWLAGLSGLIGGLLGLYVEMPRVQNERIIICEQGLLQFRKNFLKTHIEVLYWKNILAMKKAFLVREYVIISLDGNTLSISNAYQDFEELISLLHSRAD